jgi:hypothetical protein
MVRLIYLPAGKGAKKQGVDDYLASEHTVDELLAHATPDLKSPPHDEEPEHPYRATLGGLVWDKPTQNGGVPMPLTNFHEKALFVKADVAAPSRSSATTPCPSRYASIRTVGEPVFR